MSIVRRDFVRLGAAGVAAAFLPPNIAFTQTKGPEEEPKRTGASDRKESEGVAQLRGGSGSLYLKGRSGGGVLNLTVSDSTQAHGENIDRTLILQGTFQASGSSTAQNLYRSYYSCNTDRQIFMRLEDGDYSTTLVFSESDEGKTEYLTVWSDREAPQQFTIDKKKYTDTHDAKASVTSGNADKLDAAQLGKRKPPAVTVEEFENTFAHTPAFREFNRGRKVYFQHAMASSFGCAWCLSVPGAALFVPYWEN